MPRLPVLLALALLLPPIAGAKDKHWSPLPVDVLNAETVFVVIRPDAGEPLTDLSANRTAREEVEKALTKWGRFRLVTEPLTADLVFAVRTGSGQAVRPTLKGGTLDDRPIILQPTSDGNIRIGEQNRSPDLTPTGTGAQDTKPRLGTEVGPTGDMLEVYRGRVDSAPLDSAPIWRYIAKDALRPPALTAMEQFQKAVDQTQKAAHQKSGKQKP